MIKKLFWQKFLAIIINLSLLCNSFAPIFLTAIPAYAQEITPEPTSIIENTPTPEPIPTIGDTTPTITPEITPTTSPVNVEIGTLSPHVEFTTTPIQIVDNEQICLTDEVITDSTNELWNINSDIAETKEKVKLGVRYIFPQDNNVSVVFKCLPKDDSQRANLKIQKIKISDLNLPDNINNVGEYAYDVTTSMKDGDFSYDITLPKQIDRVAEVSYIEKTIDDAKANNIKSEEIKLIEESKIEQKGELVTATAIDHFTIFIVTGSTDGPVLSTALLNNKTKVIVNPNENITATIKVSTSGNGTSDDWKSTDYKIGSGNWVCVDTPDYTDNITNQEESFSFFAPNNFGTYDISFRAYNLDNCDGSGNGNPSDTITLEDAIMVANNVTNPPLAESCGFDIALVLDVSGSVDNTELQQMKDAFKGFVNALAGTPTQFSVTQFSTTAQILQPFTADTSLVLAAIDAANDDGWTNWEDGLNKAWSTFDPRDYKPNLLIFSSDGNPNRIGSGGTSASEETAVAKAVTVANTVKSSGTRILAIGIGSDLDATNMMAVSGFNVDTGDITTSDLITTNFNTMAADLGVLSSKTCGGTITVKKYLDSVSVANHGGFGWQYTIAGGTNVQLITSADGTANSGELPQGTYSIVETNIPTGYSYGSAICRDETGLEVGSTISNGIGGLSISENKIISCDFINNTNKGSITIIKSAQPQNSQDFEFNATGTGLSNFILDDDGNNTNDKSNTQTFSNLMPGEFSIAENTVTGWSLSDISCNTQEAIDLSNNKVTINLSAGENVTCTFTNNLQTGTLLVQKIVKNDNGGTKTYSDFSFKINSGADNIFDSIDGINDFNFTSGNYDIKENSVSGYNIGYNNCNINLSAGETQTCTITNDDIAPHLTLEKRLDDEQYDSNFSVTNWTLSATGSTLSFSGTGTVGQDVQAGVQYTLSESGPSGTTASVWSCTGGVLADGNKITLQAGDNVSCYIVNTAQAATLIVNKVVVNNNGGTATATDFAFKINDSGNPIPFEDDSQNVIPLDSGTYSVAEINYPGYTTTYQNCDNLNITNGETKTCTITNDDQQAYIIVDKTVNNDNGGTAAPNDFKLTVDDKAVSDGVAYAVNPGEHTVGETNLAGYTAGTWGLDCTSDGKVTVALGETKKCTITNDDQQAYITINKIVTNNNGGSAKPDDFNLTLEGQTVSSGVSIPVKPGTYTAAETLLPGYTFSGFSGECDTNGDVIVALGESKTCTLTNDDQQAYIIVDKTVNNDNGGTAAPNDFKLTVDDKAVSDGVAYAVNPGEHTVGETNLPGYTQGTWGLDCGADGKVSVALGQTKTCTITNDDQQAYITVNKIVTNNNGGNAKADDFKLTLEGTPVSSGTKVAVNPGTYTAGETLLSGYTFTGFTGECDTNGDVTVALGENKTCTITNDDVAPQLTIVKDPTNDNGGNALPDHFKLTVGGTGVLSGVKNTYTSNTPYTIDETQLSGYEFVSITGDPKCPLALGGTITLAPGDDIICTIKNDDIAPKLTIVKTVNNDNGGTKTVSDFNLYINNVSAVSGTAYDQVANQEITVSEDSVTGYTPSVWGGDCSTDGKITLSPGDNKTCTITNDDVAPHLTLEKRVVNDYNGDFSVTDWTLSATGSTLSFSGTGTVDQDVQAGVQYTLSESGPTGTTVSIWSCTGGVVVDGNKITLEAGDNVSCYIVNTAQAATLIVNKVVVNDNSGTATATDFSFKINDFGDPIYFEDDAQNEFSLDSGRYSVAEINYPGYKTTYENCSNLDIDNGETQVCTITNDDIQSYVIVDKTVVNDDGGTALADDFKLTVDTNPVLDEIAYAVNPGEHTVSETNLPGYTAGAWGTDCSRDGKVTVTLGETKTCTITNDDIAPRLKLVKNVINGTDGTKTAADWTLYAQGLGGFEDKGDSTIFHSVNAGVAYTLSESSISGYTAGNWSCDKGTLNGNNLTLGLDDEAICSITNTRDRGSLTVNKIIDEDGNLDTTNDQTIGTNWQFDVDGLSVDSSDPVAQSTDLGGSAVFANIKTGNYTVIETKQTGYDLITASCNDGNSNFDSIDSIDNVVVGKDTNITCNFYNTPNGTIHGYKWSDLNQNTAYDNDELKLKDWTINLYKWNGADFGATPIKTMLTDGSDQHFGWYWFEHLFPGQYKVCEVQQNDWVQTYPINNNDNCHLVTIPDTNPNNLPEMANFVAQSPEYNFGNVEKGEVTVYKYHDLNGNGTHESDEPYLSDWEMLINKVGSSETLSQVTNTDGYSQFKLEPTDYNLSETMKDNWYQSGIYCEDTSGVMITAEGEAYGHHGWCEGWNGCGDAATCAQWACEINGYDQMVSYGDQRPCTQFNNCHLFYNRGSIQWNWGHGCDVMGVSGIVCKNNSGINNNDNLSAAYIARDESSLYTHQFTVEPGKTKTCYVGNYQKATITVNKNVLDSQGGEIEDNSLFTVSSAGLGQTSFSELSPVTYTVNPGTYSFSEINIDSGYVLKSANDVSVTVTSGESKSIGFTNWRIPPELSIFKTNNRWPTAQTVGAEVEYTITLGLTQNDIKDVTIIDLPPHGFTYKSGSYKVLVNGIPRNIAQPSYSSPGIWYLGDLQKDDLVTLSYIVTIDNSVDPGIYKDIAWAYGCEKSENCTLSSKDKVLATAVNPGFLSSTFVGTQVKLDHVPDSKNVSIIKEEIKEIKKQLPATGSATIWLIISGLLLLLGLGFLKKEKNIMKTLIIIFIFNLFLIFPSKNIFAAQSENIFVNLETPISPTNRDNFSLSFTVLDTLNRPLIVKCFKINPNHDEIQIGSDINVQAGGSSGECDLHHSPLSESGNTYSFYAIASANGESYRSETVSVDFNNSKPGTPSDYVKEDEGPCRHRLSFKASNDGKTTKIAIYRSDLTSFIADEGSKIGQVGISPGQNGTFTDVNVPDCNKTFYYAIRAFDDANNGSDLTGDYINIYTTKIVEETTAGAILVAKDSPSKIDEQDVNGDVEIKKNIFQKVTSFFGRNKYFFVPIVLLLLGIIIYGLVKKEKKTKKPKRK